MASHQARNAQLRQIVRNVLAELRGTPLQSIPYPRSNVRLSEYRDEIQVEMCHSHYAVHYVMRIMRIMQIPVIYI